MHSLILGVCNTLVLGFFNLYLKHSCVHKPVNAIAHIKIQKDLSFVFQIQTFIFLVLNMVLSSVIALQDTLSMIGHRIFPQNCCSLLIKIRLSKFYYFIYTEVAKFSRLTL